MALFLNSLTLPDGNTRKELLSLYLFTLSSCSAGMHLRLTRSPNDSGIFFNVIREMIPLNIRSNYIIGAQAEAKASAGHVYALFYSLQKT